MEYVPSEEEQAILNDIALCYPLDDIYHLEIELRSGRTFRYELTDQLKKINSRTSTYQLRLLVELTVDEKYRHSKWDKMHPKVNSKEEIRQAIAYHFAMCLRYRKVADAVATGEAPRDMPPLPPSDYVRGRISHTHK